MYHFLYPPCTTPSPRAGSVLFLALANRAGNFRKLLAWTSFYLPNMKLTMISLMTLVNKTHLPSPSPLYLSRFSFLFYIGWPVATFILNFIYITHYIHNLINQPILFILNIIHMWPAPTNPEQVAWGHFEIQDIEISEEKNNLKVKYEGLVFL